MICLIIFVVVVVVIVFFVLFVGVDILLDFDGCEVVVVFENIYLLF